MLGESGTDEPLILIVDDNEFNSHTLKEILSMTFTLDSETALNGLEALKKYKNRLVNG